MKFDPLLDGHRADAGLKAFDKVAQKSAKKELIIVSGQQ